MLGDGGRSSVSSASASIARAPSATVCHEASACRTGSRSATNVPRPGRASTSPRATSDAIARCTVAGPARCRAISSAPTAAGRRATPRRPPPPIAVTIVAVLPSGMSVSVTLPRRTVTQGAANARAPCCGASSACWRSRSRCPRPGSRSRTSTRPSSASGARWSPPRSPAILLAWRREKLPARRDLPRFALVGVGVVIGFPIFTSLALQHTSSAHASVVVGLLPAATAAWAVARAGERPPRAFWLAAAAGLVAVLAFAATQGVGGIERADLLILAAVALGGLGYAEGGALSRRYGGWQVICWALLLTAPSSPSRSRSPPRRPARGRDGVARVRLRRVISMFLGFFAWYHGLALGGVAKIGQVQLAQPVLTLLWAALILGETITPWMLVAALAVLACVVATQRTRAHASASRSRAATARERVTISRHVVRSTVSPCASRTAGRACRRRAPEDGRGTAGCRPRG